jgi:hypothetical protein
MIQCIYIIKLYFSHYSALRVKILRVYIEYIEADQQAIRLTPRHIGHAFYVSILDSTDPDGQSDANRWS